MKNIRWRVQLLAVWAENFEAEGKIYLESLRKWSGTPLVVVDNQPRLKMSIFILQQGDIWLFTISNILKPVSLLWLCATFNPCIDLDVILMMICHLMLCRLLSNNLNTLHLFTLNVIHVKSLLNDIICSMFWMMCMKNAFITHIPLKILETAKPFLYTFLFCLTMFDIVVSLKTNDQALSSKTMPLGTNFSLVMKYIWVIEYQVKIISLVSLITQYYDSMEYFHW